MLKHYFLNLDTTQNPNGDNEVHISTCQKCPITHRIDLEYCNDGLEAVKKAQRLGCLNADGCAICCPEAHKR